MTNHLCGEEFFRHDLPFDRSSLPRWRQRMGEDKLKVLLAGESGRRRQAWGGQTVRFHPGHR